MNLLLDYDVVNAIKDINEGYTPMKIIRNDKNKWLTISLPVMFFLDWILFGNGFIALRPKNLAVFFTTYFSLTLVHGALFGDSYKERAKRNLSILPAELSSINVKTSTELLKESKCYHKVYNFKLNEKKIPQLIESKYILVPSYGINGEIEDESLLQEHVVGSKTYVLSKGSPKKVLKPALSQI